MRARSDRVASARRCRRNSCVDSSGSFIPGADVTVKNVNTGDTLRAVTSENGTFNIPAINPGTYEVSVSLTGFKRAVLSNVKVNAATPATVRATLEVGER